MEKRIDQPSIFLVTSRNLLLCISFIYVYMLASDLIALVLVVIRGIISTSADAGGGGGGGICSLKFSIALDL